MKKLLTAAASTLLLAGFAAQAQASDGTINFTGNISAASCTVAATTNGTSGTVAMPTVSASTLGAAGNTAGATQFSIKLSACTGSPTKVAVWFDASSGVNGNGRLTNTGTAKNVDVALYNSGVNAPINIGQGDGTLGSSGASVPITGTAPNQGATMYFQARYYATDVVVAGSVAASVTYTIQYQ